MARRNERGKKTGQKNVRRIVEALVHLPSVEFSRQAGHRSIDLPSKDRNRLSSGGGTLAGKRRVAVSKPRHSNYAAKLINRAADSTRRIISVEREPREKKKKKEKTKNSCDENSNVSFRRTTWTFPRRACRAFLHVDPSFISLPGKYHVSRVPCVVTTRSAALRRCNPLSERASSSNFSSVTADRGKPRKFPPSFRLAETKRRETAGESIVSQFEISLALDRKDSSSSFLFFFLTGTTSFPCPVAELDKLCPIQFRNALPLRFLSSAVSSTHLFPLLPPFFCLARFLIVGLRVRRLGKRPRFAEGWYRDTACRAIDYRAQCG